MAVAVQVPLNTALADLDDALRTLLRRELAANGFEGVAIAFDAPASDWSAALSAPTLDLFLYDLREADVRSFAEWREERTDGAARLHRSPLRLDCSYAVSAWARAPEDEHRLLSQAVAILFAYERLPADTLSGTLADPIGDRPPVTTRVGKPKADGKAEFWNAVGGRFKASIDLVATLAFEPGVSVDRGPEVRTQRLALRDRDAPPGALSELHRVGGVVHGPAAPGAWVALPDAGRFAIARPDGRFVLERVPPGRHRCLARAADGSAAEAELAVPGPGVELVLAAG